MRQLLFQEKQNYKHPLNNQKCWYGRSDLKQHNFIIDFADSPKNPLTLQRQTMFDQIKHYIINLCLNIILR